MIRRLSVLATALALVSSALAIPTALADPPSAPANFQSGNGLTVVSATSDGARTWHLTVSTAALSRPVRVNVLLPVGYSDPANATRRYPTLYLFHGTSGGADDWLTSGNAAAATAPYPLIVVMPDAGYNDDGGSWFTNWVDQSTPLGASNWETFHIGQLVPWIDANLRTIASRGGRAIAGLSQGGFGAFSYAARHPDMFVSAGSFSGAPDIDLNPLAKLVGLGIIGATATGLDGVEPFAMFGDPILDDINYQGHNPANLVTNLADTSLNLWTGDGIPGALDTPSINVVPDALIEGAVHASTLFFTQAASSAGVGYYLDDYGAGTHSWPYWARDLTQYLPRLMATLAAPGPTPTTISYRSVDRTWTQWGWTVSNNRVPSQAWSGLAAASKTGFTALDATPSTVTTPAVYVPGASYRLRASGGTVPASVTASSTGTLQIPVTPALLSAAVTVTVASA